jgi:hypothetical protein
MSAFCSTFNAKCNCAWMLALFSRGFGIVFGDYLIENGTSVVQRARRVLMVLYMPFRLFARSARSVKHYLVVSRRAIIQRL